jgi:hypothetical protein
VTGEIPFGGRSAQFLHNEAAFAALCEFYADLFKKYGDLDKAGKFKSAAGIALESITYWLKMDKIYHVKNYYDNDSMYGCEGYAYFNKYIAQPDLLKDRDCYMLHIYDTKEDAYHCISYEESNFNRFFEAAKSCSDIPTVDKDLYFIEDMTNNDFIGVLVSSNELDVFIDHINED